MAYPGANSAVPSDASVTQQSVPAGSPLPDPNAVAQVPPPESSQPIFNDPEMRAQILRPTDRPGVPVTNGMPHGPGAQSYVRHRETDDRFRERVAQTLSTAPYATERVRRFAARLARGR